MSDASLRDIFEYRLSTGFGLVPRGSGTLFLRASHRKTPPARNSFQIAPLNIFAGLEFTSATEPHLLIFYDGEVAEDGNLPIRLPPEKTTQFPSVIIKLL